jgi:hypothetical protein
VAAAAVGETSVSRVKTAMIEIVVIEIVAPIVPGAPPVAVVESTPP